MQESRARGRSVAELPALSDENHALRQRVEALEEELRQSRRAEADARAAKEQSDREKLAAETELRQAVAARDQAETARAEIQTAKEESDRRVLAAAAELQQAVAARSEAESTAQLQAVDLARVREDLERSSKDLEARNLRVSALERDLQG